MKPSLFSYFLLLSVSAFGQHYAELIGEAEKAYAEKSYGRSVKMYENAFHFKPGTARDYYNAACSAALEGNSMLSIKWLNDAISRDYDDLEHFQSDTDLNSLHQLQEWGTLTSKLKQRVAKIESGYDKSLQAKLLAIYNDDQAHRREVVELIRTHGPKAKELPGLWKIIERKDSINLLEVRSILDQYGWVGPEKVGKRANSTLFLVIQHSDLPTQQMYLPMMREAVKANKAEPGELAMLEDRVALGEGKKQIFGTQIGEDSSGVAYVLPLADPESVDERRASVGLPALSTYLKQWGVAWDLEAYKKNLQKADVKNK